jgi:hypothetical protein
VGDRSRGRFAKPADFPLHDCSPYSHVHVRRESVGVVRRSRASFCRPVCQTTLADVTIRTSCCVAVLRGSQRVRPRCVSPHPFPWTLPKPDTNYTALSDASNKLVTRSQLLYARTSVRSEKKARPRLTLGIRLILTF